MVVCLRVVNDLQLVVVQAERLLVLAKILVGSHMRILIAVICWYMKLVIVLDCRHLVRSLLALCGGARRAARRSIRAGRVRLGFGSSALGHQLQLVVLFVVALDVSPLLVTFQLWGCSNTVDPSSESNALPARCTLVLRRIVCVSSAFTTSAFPIEVDGVELITHRDCLFDGSESCHKGIMTLNGVLVWKQQLATLRISSRLLGIIVS